MSRVVSHSGRSASFLYVALRPGGGKRVGMRQAGSAAALSHALRLENLLLLNHYKLPAWAAKESELSLQDQAALNEQLGNLLTRGVPLVEALDVVTATVKPAAKGRVARMRELVASGTSFADACKQTGGFDIVTIAVYRGAERTGDLGGAAKELAINARRRLAVQGKATTLMIYPVVVLSISLIVGTLMLMIVVPMIAEGLKAASNIKLPLYSRIVFATGQTMRDNATLVGVGVGLGLVGLLVGRVAVINLFKIGMRKLPVIRDVVLAQECARFFSVMAAMTRTGVPISDALGVANQAIAHPTLRKQLDRLRTRLIEGGLLRNLIEEVTSFPIATRRLLVAAERSGDMEHAFGTLAADMTDEVDRSSSRLLAVLEPALIVVMFLIIGSLLLSLLLPMLTISGGMK
jgi:general secretion pathway protein F